MVLADYRAYIEAQEQANQTYRDPLKWAKMAIQNVAGSGKSLQTEPFRNMRMISEVETSTGCQKKLMFIIARNFGILFLAACFTVVFHRAFARDLPFRLEKSWNIP